MKERTKYWIDLSEYDLVTAKALLKSGRYLYVGFMCHQSIEKIIKAYYNEQKENNPPFSHSLSYLAEVAGLTVQLIREQTDFITELEPLNIEARYPSHKKELLKSLNKAKCEELLRKTESLQEWVKQKL